MRHDAVGCCRRAGGFEVAFGVFALAMDVVQATPIVIGLDPARPAIGRPATIVLRSSDIRGAARRHRVQKAHAWAVNRATVRSVPLTPDALSGAGISSPGRHCGSGTTERRSAEMCRRLGTDRCCNRLCDRNRGSGSNRL